MKTKQLFSWKLTSLFLLGMAIISAMGCHENDDVDYLNNVSETQDDEWVNFIEDLSLNPSY